MLKIENHNKLRGDFIEYNGYTLYIDSITDSKNHYKIIVGLRNGSKIEDYVAIELSKHPNISGNYKMHQSANPHYLTDVTISCIENLDWFGYMTCRMVGENSWQMKIPGYNIKQPQKKLK